MPKVPTQIESIRCRECGYTTSRFHGWVFAVTACRNPGVPSAHHNWKAVVK